MQGPEYSAAPAAETGACIAPHLQGCQVHDRVSQLLTPAEGCSPGGLPPLHPLRIQQTASS